MKIFKIPHTNTDPRTHARTHTNGILTYFHSYRYR